jgi:hypothetical protein
MILNDNYLKISLPSVKLKEQRGQKFQSHPCLSGMHSTEHTQYALLLVQQSLLSHPYSNAVKLFLQVAQKFKK